MNPLSIEPHGGAASCRTVLANVSWFALAHTGCTVAGVGVFLASYVRARSIVESALGLDVSGFDSLFGWWVAFTLAVDALVTVLATALTGANKQRFLGATGRAMRALALSDGRDEFELRSRAAGAAEARRPLRPTRGARTCGGGR
jgi:hypothetical protein